MLIAALSWTYQLFVILPFGFFFQTLWRKEKRRQGINCESFLITFLVGLAVITSIASFFSLFINIGWQVHLILLITAILMWVFLLKKKILGRIELIKFTHSMPQIISLGLLIFAISVVLLASTYEPANADTGIYHAQSIRWIETYKAVPGLANLHTRLGYNSSWLLANALFSLSFLGIQSFHLLPSTLFFVCVIYFFGGLHALLDGHKKLSDLIKAIYLIAAFLFLSNEISSPGTDLPVTLIIWVISVEWIKLFENPSESVDRNFMALVLISFFCVTIKLSSAPLLLLPLSYLFYQAKHKRLMHSIIFVGASFLFIFIPYISRNVIISGHLVYPGLSFDPVNVEWSVPMNIVERESKIIHWFALMPRVSFQEFNELNWQTQYKIWFYDQIPRHKAILIYVFVIPAVWVFLLVLKKWRTWIRETPGYIFILFSMYSGILFWLFSAPSFRFGYGFLLATVTLSGAPIILQIIEFKKALFPVFKTILLVVSIVICLKNFHNFLDNPPKFSQYLLPLDYPKYSTIPCEYGNFKLLCPAEYDACWYDPFPCGIRPNENLFMRGEDYSEGFIQLTQK